MREADLPEVVQELLRRFKAVGGTLNYVVLEVDSSITDPAALHRQAVLDTFRVLRGRSPGSWNTPASARGLSYLLAGGGDRYASEWGDEPRRLGRLSGRRGTVREFLGHDRKRGVDLPDWPPDEPAEPQPTAGYGLAFSSPPNGLNAGPEEIERLYTEINEHLFGNFRDDVDVYRWSFAWTSYWKGLEEWRGSLVWTWTAHRPASNWVIGIRASRAASN